MTEYISTKGEAALKRYKYSGNDSSIFYKFVISPLALALVQVLPRTLAPNVITLFAFSLHIVAYSLAPSDESPPDAWWCWLCALTYFFYQVLDNADGKQARRIGCSSPLGLIMDHGCDAISTVLITANTMFLLRFNFDDEAIYNCIVLGMPMLVFFFCTWEEYNSGILELGLINGPNEGVLSVSLMNIFEALYPGIVHLYRFQIVTYSSIFIIFAVSSSIHTVLKSTEKGQRRREIISSIPFLFCLILGFYYFVTSDAKIFSKHPQKCIWLIGLSFSKLVTHLQVAHVSEDVFNPWRKTFTVPLILITANIWFPFAFEENLLNFCLLVAAISWLHLAVSVILQIQKVLKVPFLATWETKRG